MLFEVDKHPSRSTPFLRNRWPFHPARVKMANRITHDGGVPENVCTYVQTIGERERKRGSFSVHLKGEIIIKYLLPLLFDTRVRTHRW